MSHYEFMKLLKANPNQVAEIWSVGGDAMLKIMWDEKRFFRLWRPAMYFNNGSIQPEGEEVWYPGEYETSMILDGLLLARFSLNIPISFELKNGKAL